MFQVLIKKRVLKEIEKLPNVIQEKLAALIDGLRDKGPVQAGWPNYSKIGKDRHHCHLSRKWVACWNYENKSL